MLNCVVTRVTEHVCITSFHPIDYFIGANVRKFTLYLYNMMTAHDTGNKET